MTVPEGRIGAVLSFHDDLLADAESLDQHELNGWGTLEGQTARFNALIRAANYRGGSVVDFGCGTGALLPYLESLGYPFTYLGLDMNPAMLPTTLPATLSAPRSGGFRVIAADTVDFPPADHVFASGIFQFADRADPFYYRRLAGQLFGRCRVALSVNFLSALRDRSAKDPEELYLLPAEAVGLASSLSGRWLLDHSYHPDRGDMTLSIHV
jgi:SAM-dependent methyltransferase